MLNSISLNDTNNEEPLPICRSNRQYFVDRSTGLKQIMALWYFSSKDVLQQKNEVELIQKTLNHIKKCPRCKSWFHSIIPEAILRRQKRLTQYCCSGMFVAIEEPKRYISPIIKFEMFRGEDPSWIIGKSNAFFSFCPWCGKKMPDKPFIDEK